MVRRCVLLLLAAALVAAAPQFAVPARSQQPAAAAQSLYLITYRPGPAWQAGVPMTRQHLDGHAAYWKQLVATGRAFAAGGFSTSDGGLAIVMAADIADARGIVARDPAVISGVFVGTIEQWTPFFRTDHPLPPTR